MITDLTSRQASPERLATILRAHWVIENKLHFVRDTAFREDTSKIRAGHGPENMATPSAASPLTGSARPATPTSPPDSARQPSAPTNDRWPSSASTDLHQIHDQKTLQSPCLPMRSECPPGRSRRGRARQEQL
ncbi:hypothetical protein ABZ826_24410 [Streptomyces sp. NPDC047515]|uniref:hypothetical protein n=1 Tax=Streptomyces sp. NPDC047515 TaxID=3155380 RepID=UPI00340A8C83